MRDMQDTRSFRFAPLIAMALAVGCVPAGFRASGAVPDSETPAATIAVADSVETVAAEETGSAAMPVSEAPAEPEKILTAAVFFVSAPTSVFPTIDPMTRMDMIDYFKAGSDKPSKNLIGGECRISLDTPEKLVFTTSPVSEYTIALLPAPGRRGKTVIMLSRTLKTPAEDSTVTFYDTDWNELKGLFKVPTLDDWMVEDARKKRADVENAVPFVLAKLEYFPEKQSAVFTNNLPDYIPEESLGIAQSSIRKSITFHWDGKRLVMEK